jgi:hypothetical protein
MAKAKGVHVVKSGKGWAVKSGGRTRSTHRTQANASKAGRAVAKRGSTELYVHGRNGQIREANSYGRDPHPPKG